MTWRNVFNRTKVFARLRKFLETLDTLSLQVLAFFQEGDDEDEGDDERIGIQLIRILPLFQTQG